MSKFVSAIVTAALVVGPLLLSGSARAATAKSPPASWADLSVELCWVEPSRPVPLLLRQFIMRLSRFTSKSPSVGWSASATGTVTVGCSANWCLDLNKVRCEQRNFVQEFFERDD